MRESQIQCRSNINKQNTAVIVIPNELLEFLRLFILGGTSEHVNRSKWKFSQPAVDQSKSETEHISAVKPNLTRKMTNVLWITCIGWICLLSVHHHGCDATGLGFFSEISPADTVSDSPTLLSRTHTRTRREDSQSALKDAENVIPRNYSIHEPPPPDGDDGAGGSTNVDFYILIVGVRNIQEVTEELQVELNLQIYWKDTRLSHLADKSGNRFVVLNPVLIEQIWHPDIFIDHVKKIEQPKLISTPASLRIYPDSTIRYSGRLTITMACSFDFHFFPADTQRCAIEFKSYAYSDKYLTLDWREHKPAAIKQKLSLPNFRVGLGNTQNFTVITSSGRYSAISFTIVLRRLLNFHLIQTYLPSALFIIVSWLSFLVSPESIPGRMTLCITTLLTITAMFSSVRQNIPNVSYIKALDIWMVTCIIFVFFTLLEYTVILKLKSIKPKPPTTPASVNNSFSPNSSTAGATPKKMSNGSMGRDKSSSNPLNTPTWVHITQQGDHVCYGGNSNGCACSADGIRHRTATGTTTPATPVTPASSTSTSPSPSAHEDVIARIESIMSKLIPACFVLFNCIYWPWLILAADYFNDQEFENTNYAL